MKEISNPVIKVPKQESLPINRYEEFRTLWRKATKEERSILSSRKKEYMELDDWCKKELEESDCKKTFFAETDQGKLVGIIRVEITRKFGFNNFEAHIYNLFVEEQYRGHTIGSLLMNEAFRFLFKRTIVPSVVNLDVAETNTRAISFYDRKGFKIVQSKTKKVRGISYCTMIKKM